MTPERFCTLLDSYGADVRRWPELERAPAQELLARCSSELGRQLADAGWLDGWLDQHCVAEPGDDMLRHAVVAAAQVNVAPRRGGWAPGRWFWPGIGWAGVGLAGTLAGIFAASIVLRGTMPAPGVDWAEHGTAFGFNELTADWSEQ